jgi:hypothetical protein
MNLVFGILLCIPIIASLLPLLRCSHWTVRIFDFPRLQIALAIILGSALGAGIAAVIHFFAFYVDYTRTENVQFEDDDYYYYVKAVPKVTLSAPEKKVKKINSQRHERSRN